MLTGLGQRTSRATDVGRLSDAGIPELFPDPVLERLREKWERERLQAVPYYDGLQRLRLTLLRR
jgi:hypothetical protein